MFDPLDACPRRTSSYRRFEHGKRLRFPRGSELHISIASILDPSGEPKLASFLDDVPPESHTLHSTPYLEMDALHFALSLDSQESGQRCSDCRGIGETSSGHAKISVSDSPGDLIERRSEGVCR